MEKNRLTVFQIKTFGDGKFEDGAGLRLVRRKGYGTWVYRYSFAGQRREMGLGSQVKLTLAQARKLRDRWAAELTIGKDPINQRNKIREAELAEINKNDPTFAELADLVFETKKSGLRGKGERGRWFSPLRVHVIPKLGKRRISQIHQTDIRNVLQPIWQEKPATAQKAIQRTRIIFRQARLMGIDVDPFTVDAAQHMLGEVDRKIEPITATPWQEIPALFLKLDRPNASCQALRFAILTGVRSEGVRGARFSEIKDDVWTVPADRMKGKQGKAQEFRVPLSLAALAIVKACREMAQDDFLFPSYRKGKYISSTAIAKPLNEMNEAGRPHGFRTSFRTWVQDTEAASFDVAETALSHTIGNKVERSYARSDLLAQRRILMEKWGSYVTGKSAQIVKLRG
ncbi:tyrosine-type recombinase/integrase [Pseudogemmobacter sp. W21_MBD1_M6]|uniref:tyrosine-type recombinase/integrase n=1 Tax=Pseudogemmobacter sp. W21_MBD1_M6 TaxID=3240271 RepID=UPI003F959D57